MLRVEATGAAASRSRLGVSGTMLSASSVSATEATEVTAAAASSSSWLSSESVGCAGKEVELATCSSVAWAPLAEGGAFSATF
jgi:hypothetical protein